MSKHTEIILHTDFIRGLVYSDLDLTKVNFKRGERLTLVPEPDNDHDSDAIAVYRGKTRLGYIRKEETAKIHEWNESYRGQAAFRCTVKQWVPTNASHRMLLVEVAVRVPNTAVIEAGVPAFAAY